MNINLTNKNAYVGGGSKGIGLASAVELANLGANVTLVSRGEQGLQEAVKHLDTSKGQKHRILAVDYSNLDNLELKLKEAISKVGVFHIIVNNTGGPAGGLIQNANLEEFKSAFNNHLLANHLIVQTFLPKMKEANYGRIINIISTSVKIPLANLGVSNTIRGAVASWSKTMANELGEYGITVNNVLPGATATERLESIIQTKADKTGAEIEAVERSMKSIIPMKRFAEPNEVGAVVAFLASPAASYVNGVSIPVDGGRTGSI